MKKLLLDFFDNSLFYRPHPKCPSPKETGVVNYRRSLFLLTLTLFTFNGNSQDRSVIDSLKNELVKFEGHKKQLADRATPLMDSTKANILNSLSREYTEANYDTAMNYAQMALSLSENIGFKKGIGNVYNSMGRANYSRQKYQVAIDYYQRSVKIRDSLGDKDGMGRDICYIGLAYTGQKNFPEALKNYLAGIKLFEETGDHTLMARAYDCIANDYMSQNMNINALKNYAEELKMQEKTGDKKGRANTYASMANASDKNYPEKLKYYILKHCCPTKN